MSLQLEAVAVGYGGRAVLSKLTLELGPVESGCLLGASGCGKTTLLRAIAGLEPLLAGRIRIDGEIVAEAHTGVPPERRDAGMVFQDCALFPHLDVRRNIAFGLSDWDRQRRERRVSRLAEMLNLERLLAKHPHQLSGGQQQRVALARAIAPRPRLLLLDEPFANLDIEAREYLAQHLKEQLAEEGITTLMVSHHQHEAFAMGDRVGVLHAGRLLQWDTPFELYHRPRHAYVAGFVGEGTFLPGRVVDRHCVETSLGMIEGDQPHGYADGIQVRLLLRPDDIIHDDGAKLKARVVEKIFRGAQFLYLLALDSGELIYSLVPSHHDHGIDEWIGIRLEIDHVVLFPWDKDERRHAHGETSN